MPPFLRLRCRKFSKSRLLLLYQFKRARAAVPTATARRLKKHRGISCVRFFCRVAVSEHRVALAKLYTRKWKTLVYDATELPNGCIGLLAALVSRLNHVKPESFAPKKYAMWIRSKEQTKLFLFYYFPKLTPVPLFATILVYISRPRLITTDVEST